MTVPEMIYVLDKEKECIQRRSINDCCRDCEKCDCRINSKDMLDAFERIVNLIYNVDKHSTRKSY